MKVLMISMDRLLFDAGSSVRKRIATYGEQLEHLDVIVFTKRGDFSIDQVSARVTLHPTNSRSRFLYIADAIRIGKQLGSFDVITTQNPGETGLVGLVLSKKKQTRLEVQLHGDVFNPYADRHPRWHPLGIIRRMLARIVLPKANCVRVVSNSIADSLKRHVTLRVEPIVLPIFVDVSRFAHTPARCNLKTIYPQFEYIMLWVGRLEKEKQADMAIRILAKIVGNYPKAGLVIVGEGRERSRLEALVSSLNLTSHVVFEGWQDDVISRYKSADVLLATSAYEGYGMVIVEALAAGCPVVSRDIGAAREAGAVVSDDETFAATVMKQLGAKHAKGTLLHYPYENEASYTRALVKQWERCG